VGLWCDAGMSMNFHEDERIESGWLYHDAIRRYRRLCFRLIVEILLWVAVIFLAIAEGMLNFATPSSVSVWQRDISVILLVLLLIPFFHSLFFYQNHTAGRFNWLAKKDLLRCICPNCRYDLRKQITGEVQQITCPECGSIWNVGEALYFKQCESVYHIISRVLQIYATIFSIVYLISYYYFSVNLFFFTVKSIGVVIGVSVGVVGMMQIWVVRCFGFPVEEPTVDD